jgi:aspartyl-tRNA(Asn)/glutamyl-tRNA(Gln) amidotransferase subunit C
MAISREEVLRIAALARLRFSEAELDRLAAEMETILAYVRKLDELDTSEVEPMTHVHVYGQVVRRDAAGEELSRGDALKGAAGAGEQYFHVPKVIE